MPANGVRTNIAYNICHDMFISSSAFMVQYFVQNPDILRYRMIFVEKIGKVTGGGYICKLLSKSDIYEKCILFLVYHTSSVHDIM